MKKHWVIDVELNMCANKHLMVYVDAKTKRLALMKAKKQLDEKQAAGMFFFYMIESCKQL